MRSYKLDDFAAHAGGVICLRIGRKSSGVLATGGNDKLVKVWAIGKPNAILSLAGHQSPVECVNFDAEEEVVAAGGQNGTVKIWDLNATQAVRTLTGHRSSCLAVEFHPFNGDYIATGSLDTNLKVWDLRRKDCIQTYKGHHKGLRHVAVSPDGRWVASGCEAGEVKIWELSSGRLLKDLKSHDNQITGLQFHPQEFLLTTASADRSVCTWDLESWELLHKLGPEAQPIRAIHFHPGGRELLVATQDCVKVWGIDPGRHYDTVPVSWGKVADVSVFEHRLIGCSASGGSVGVYVVDLKRVAPFSQNEATSSGGGSSLGAREAADVDEQHEGGSGAGVGPGQEAQQSVHLHRDWAMRGGEDEQAQQRKRQQQVQQEHPQSGRAAGASALGRCSSEKALSTQREQQQQHNRTLRQQCSMGDKVAGPRAAAAAAVGPEERRGAGQLARQRAAPRELCTGAAFPDSGASPRNSNFAVATGAAAASAADQLAAVPLSSKQRTASVGTSVGESLLRGQLQQEEAATAADDQRQAQKDAATSMGGVEGEPAAGGSKGTGSSSSGGGLRRVSGGHGGFPEVEIRVPAHPPPPSVSAPAAPIQQQERKVSFSFRSPREDGVPSSGAARPPLAPSPTAAAASGAVPSLAYGSSGAAPAHTGTGAAAAAAAAAAADPLVAAAAYRPGLRGDLSRALSALQVARGFVARGNLEGAYRAVAQAGDAAAAAMLLEALQGRKDAFEVAAVGALVRALEVCLAAGPDQEHINMVALGALSLVLRGPGQTIRQTLAASAIGVDLSFEARREKCAVAKLGLQGLGVRLAALGRSGGAAVASRARQVVADLQALDG